jgi:putative ABC transport system substrate-binding protein
MQFDQLRRREFITLLGGAAVAWPLAARSQQAAKLPTIGYLGANTPSAESQRIAAFVQRLGALGWIEGRTIAIEVRWAEGRNERFAAIASEFRLKVDVIVVAGTAAVVSAKQVTSAIPVVFAVAGEPVGSVGRESGATRWQRHSPGGHNFVESNEIERHG